MPSVTTDIYKKLKKKRFDVFGHRNSYIKVQNCKFVANY